MTNKGLSISLTLIPAAEVLQKGSSVFKHEIDMFSLDSLFFAPLRCCTMSTHYIREYPTKRKHILLPLRQITQEDGFKWYTRLGSNQLNMLSSSAIPWTREKKQIFVHQLRNGRPLGDNTIPRCNLLEVAIDLKYFLNNSFAVFSVFGLDDGSYSCPKYHRIRIVKRRPPPDNDADECIHILSSGTNLKNSMAYLEFEDLIGPAECEDSFMLGIDHLDFSSRSLGIFLLLPNGKSFNEVIREARNHMTYNTCDRAAITLPSGRVISAALRKRVRDSTLMYAVDFDVRLSPSI
jgi:hypothetical protein